MPSRGKKRFTEIIVILTTIIAVAGIFMASDRSANNTSSLLPTASAAESNNSLNRPYEDWRQQEIPFGTSSLDLAPWRSYMDTWDTSRYLETAGIGFNVNAQEADATAQLLAEAGFRSARYEISWNNISYEDESKFTETSKTRIQKILQAMRKHGLRPIILLNANAGLPVPNKKIQIRLKDDAKKGSREIYVTEATGIIPNYTGLSGQAYQTMYPVITNVDAATGRLTLSAPLTKDLKSGPIDLTILKYRPFSGSVYEGGKANPDAQATYNGWQSYVKTVTTEVKRILGTQSAADAGFDLEVWNELSFGSQFLDINNYFEEKRSFESYPSVTIDNRKFEGIKSLLPLTIQYVRNPANKLPGVTIIDGFSNQRPWENGTELITGQNGFSRHYYTGYTDTSRVAQSDLAKKNKYMNYAGAIYDGKDTQLPDHIVAFPEYWFYGYQTEYIVRDLQPIPGPWKLHSRYANNGNGQPAQVWMTETNWWRGFFAKELMQKANVNEGNAKLISLMHQIGTKASLRLLNFASHKGVHTVDIFSAKGGDLNYGVIPDAFFKTLALENYQLTNKARAAAGPQLEALGFVAKLMRSGIKINNPRPIRVEEVVEPQERLIWKGNGTNTTYDLYNRDDFAILPYQLSDNKFAIAYYVVTRDLTKTQNASKSLLDPVRYNMEPQKFMVTLSNIKGSDVSEVYAYDPITQKKVSTKKVASTASTLTVEVESVDYPRYLIVAEKSPSKNILLTDTKLEQKNGTTYFSFKSNSAGKADLSWGPYPIRSGGTFTGEKYRSKTDTVPVETLTSPVIDSDRMPNMTEGIWKWKGTITPEYSEKYTFLIDGTCKTGLKIDGNTLIDGCQTLRKMADMELIAGHSYDLELMVESGNTSPGIVLYWSSDHMPKTLVAADSKGKNKKTIDVRAGAANVIELPGFLPNDGVKVTLKSEDQSLITRFPQWDYDVKGVWWK